MSNGETELVLPLLEKRPYLHGTTLFDALLGDAPSVGRLSFSISKRLDTDRVLIYRRPASDAARRDEAARLTWRTTDANGVVGVVPLPPSPQPERRPYAEGLVVDRLKLEGKGASLMEPSPFSFVATLIPMFKSLLRATTEMPGPGQWMFTRLDVDRHPGDFIPVRLSLDMVRGALARSAIEVRGQLVGSLYFSWVRSSSPSVLSS